MKLLQKISVGALIILGFVGLGVKTSFAEITQRNLGAFSVSIDSQEKVTSQVAESGPYTTFIFPDINAEVMMSSNINFYKKNGLNTGYMIFVKKEKIGSYEFSIYKQLFESVIELPAAPVRLTYYIEDPSKGIAYHIMGENAVELAKTFKLNSKINTFRYFYLDFNQINGDNSGAAHPPSCYDAFTSVVRTGPYTTGTAKQALNSLISNTRVSDLESEFSWVSGETNTFTFIGKKSIIKSLTIKNKIAYVDFKKLELLDEDISIGNCKSVSLLKEQITRTLTQFPTIKDVKITINGVSFEKYFKTKQITESIDWGQVDSKVLNNLILNQLVVQGTDAPNLPVTLALNQVLDVNGDGTKDSMWTTEGNDLYYVFLNIDGKPKIATSRYDTNTSLLTLESVGRMQYSYYFKFEPTLKSFYQVRNSGKTEANIDNNIWINCEVNGYTWNETTKVFGLNNSYSQNLRNKICK